jgi:hypothetical protein
MYADSITGSMQKAIDETNRRRAIQQKYNTEHGLIPKTIKKEIRDVIEIGKKEKAAISKHNKGEKKLTAEQVRNLRFIPFAAEGTEFIMDAGMFTTESKVIVPVFECKAPYKEFLADMDRQELINLINECKNVYEVYPGVKVGAMDAATNDAGNWE